MTTTPEAPPRGPLAPPVENRARRWLHALGAVAGRIGRAPFTALLVAALWITGAATGSLGNGPSDGLLEQIGTGVPALADGRWWTPLSALLWCPGLGAYLGATFLLLLLVPPAEQRVGTARTAAVFLAGQLVGTLAGLALVRLGELAGEDWLALLASDLTATPSVGAIAVGGFLSFRLTALWRRRLRLLLLAFPLVFTLYVGHLQDVLRLTGALAGLAFGLVAHRGTSGARLRPVHSSHTERRVLVALVVAASAVGPAIGALYQEAYGPFSILQELYVSEGPDSSEIAAACAESAEECNRYQALDHYYSGPALLMGVVVPLLFLVLAEGLRRGLRPAWRTAVAAQLGLLALMAYLLADYASNPGDYRVDGAATSDVVQALAEQMLLPLVVLLVLLGSRRHFELRLPSATVTSLAGVISGALLLACAAYTGIGYAVREQFDGSPSFPGLVAGLPAQFLPAVYEELFFDPPVPVGATARALHEYCGLLFWAVTLAALFVAFRRPRLRNDDRAAERARALLTAQGGGTLSYLTTWQGKHYWFSADGTAAVAYRVHSTVALTTGDPFGAPGARADAVEGFARHCDARGWTPCFYSVTEATRERGEALGWQSVQVAEDTLVPLPELAFTGKKWQDVRTALNKAKKEGITAEWYAFPDMPIDLADQIRSISEEWVADKGLPEMGFTLGGLDELDDPRVRCLVAVGDDRTVHGVTSWMPVYGGGGDGGTAGWTLDFMRRRSDGFKGSMEFLIASAALGFKEEGARFLSLSGAPLARVGPDGRSAALQRLLDWAGGALEPVYGFRSLLNFKAKFQPQYRPMYMTYPDAAALPAITRAIGKAYLPHMSASQAVRLMRRLSA
ncbi:bifunctional lysylphosphatidylglycerol flippase/synthetase MprF [Streptomyces sp. NPDC050504]|uniref:bifunctional lysylphosphatidylglycerol flippase/synthetase MprF n=1 Tax=Streptomyces sp. NPDC050504 TaxID=3365618 RepID=UPI00379A1E0C